MQQEPFESPSFISIFEDTFIFTSHSVIELNSTLREGDWRDYDIPVWEEAPVIHWWH